MSDIFDPENFENSTDNNNVENNVDSNVENNVDNSTDYSSEDSTYHYSYRKAQEASNEAGSSYSYTEPTNTESSYTEPSYTESSYTGPEMNYSAEPEKKKKFGFGKKKGSKSNKNSFGGKLARMAAYGLVFGLVAGAAFQGVSYGMKRAGISSNGATELAATSTVKTSSGSTSDLTTVAENVLPSIVSITGNYQTTTSNFFGQSQTEESQGAGSGIIVGKDSKYIYIATNNHVVEDSTSLSVGFCDDTTADAEIKGTDSDNDLAVVEVKVADVKSDTLSEIKVITIGDSDDLKVGEQAIAIGNALGYGQSVTGGYISATAREVELTDNTMTLIQTDAAINPGNSGGALLNSAGELIGINSVKYSSEEVEGMGYAIPVNTAMPIIKQLIKEETIPESEQAYMGITGTDVTSEMASAYDMPEGIYIREVADGSPAQSAGIQAGDVLVEFDGNSVTTMESLQAKLAKKKAGTKVKIKVKRQSQMGDYENQTLTITLGSKSQAQSN